MPVRGSARYAGTGRASPRCAAGTTLGTDMPGPNDLPVLVYDGRCAFCVREVERLKRMSRSRVRIESFHEPGVLARYPSLTRERCEEAIQMVVGDGRVFSVMEAVARTLLLRGPLGWAAWLYYLPGVRQALDAGYRMVARNRYRLLRRSCPDETCGPHRPDQGS